MRKKGKIIKLAEEFSIVRHRNSVSNRSVTKNKHYDYGQSIQLEYSHNYEQDHGHTDQLISESQSYFNVQAFENVDDRFEVESFSVNETGDEILQYSTINENEERTNATTQNTSSSKAQSIELPLNLYNASYELTAPEVRESLSDDALDFQKDVQAILTGQKQYEHHHQQNDSTPNEEDHDLSQQSSLVSPAHSKSGHEVFDRMLESMSTANSFDLGTLDLQKTFDEFDRKIINDEEQKKAKAKSSEEFFTKAASAEFVHDLADLDYTEDITAIEERSLGESKALPPNSSSPVSNSNISLQKSDLRATEQVESPALNATPAITNTINSVPDSTASVANNATASGEGAIVQNASKQEQPPQAVNNDQQR